MGCEGCYNSVQATGAVRYVCINKMPSIVTLYDFCVLQEHSNFNCNLVIIMFLHHLLASKHIHEYNIIGHSITTNHYHD